MIRPFWSLWKTQQAAAEREGEYISNNLLRRIESLKAEKEQLLTQVEREEEYLTNTLQRQLAQLRQEKIELETAMEREQEFIINRLQQQVDQLGLPALYARRPSALFLCTHMKAGRPQRDASPLRREHGRQRRFFDHIGIGQSRCDAHGASGGAGARARARVAQQKSPL